MNLVLSVVLTVIMGSIISDITVALAQLNDNTSRNNSIASTDRKHIVVTWLKANETEPDNSPVISVSNQDFWNAFSPLLEVSTNRTNDNSE
jgi:hypothetical protein